MGKTDDLMKNKHLGIVLLFMLEYLCAYYAQRFVPLVAVVTIAASYRTIWKNNNFAPVVMLILSARVINGFIFPGISYSYTIMMVITYYLPSIVFIVRNLIIHDYKIRLTKKRTNVFGPALLYGCYITIAFILNFYIAKSMFLVAVLPLILFLLYAYIIPPEDFFNCIQTIIYYLRMIFIVSLVIYILPNYAEITTKLLSTGMPFGEPTDISGTYTFMGMFRNNGIFFDCRILGIFTYLHIYLVGKTYKNLSIIDVILCTITILTTLSRGGILVYAIILLGYLIVSKRSKAKTFFIIMVCVMGLLCLVLYLPVISDTALRFLGTFNLRNANNVLAQRSVMSDYAMKAFYRNPMFGEGFGSLMAKGIERSVYSDIHGVTYTVVTDAYLLSLLGELGIFGTFLFSFQLLKIVIISKKKRIMSVLLYFGLMIHMLGTDIPNMRMVYFVILMIIFISNWQDTKEFNNAQTI